MALSVYKIMFLPIHFFFGIKATIISLGSCAQYLFIRLFRLHLCKYKLCKYRRYGSRSWNV